MAIEVGEYIESALQSLASFHVRETAIAFLEVKGGQYHAGAVGLALIGKLGDAEEALRQWRQVSNTSPAGQFAAAAHLLGVSIALIRLVEANYRNGMPAGEIVRGLRLGNLGLQSRAARSRPKAARKAASFGREVPQFPVATTSLVFSR